MAIASILAALLPLVAHAEIATPSFSPLAGTYDHNVAVTLSCATAGARIYYTTDGTDPTTASILYAGSPLAVTNHVAAGDDPDPADSNVPLLTVSAAIRAIAVVDGLGTSPVAAADYVIDKVDSSFNIPYDEPPAAGGSKHVLDVYHPHGYIGTRVLLFIHGGAWKQGDKNIYLELGNTFAGYYGITTVIASYELSAEPWNAIHPAHMQDVARAFAWVYRNIASYGGDPARLFVFGQSAGGHLVSLLATDRRYLEAEGLAPELIRGLISMSGVYRLTDLVQFPLNPLGLNAVDVLGYKTLCLNTFGSWDAAVLEAASPATYASAVQP
ncbi:MAG: chitobiase/beta-hexosaminidase C-terminal domain-containing protein, partial [Acidobacteriota bacterium]